MTMHYGGMVITVVPSVRLRRQNTSSGCATTARRQGTLGDIAGESLALAHLPMASEF